MVHEVTAGVFLGGRRVGTLGYRDGNTWFDYEDRDPNHPVLGQGFEAEPGRRRTASGTIPEWFANLLPEPGSGLRQLVGGQLGRTNPHDFQVITFLGADLPGAVQVRADADVGGIPEFFEKDECAHDHPVRFSLAGVQAKFSMRWQGKALVLPASGQGGDWIVKLPDRRFADVPSNEFAMLNWAKLAGIDVPETRLLTGRELSGLPAGIISDDEPALAVRRFDRDPQGRVHQEDFAQVREVSAAAKYDRATYSGLARVIKAVCPPEDVDEFIRRLAMTVVIGNLDAHLKNWTLRYPDGRSARLSPAYDFVSVSVYPEFRAEELAFALNGGRIARAISPSHFGNLAERAGLDSAHVIGLVRETVTRLCDTWPQVKRDLPVPRPVVDHVDERLRTLPLVTAG